LSLPPLIVCGVGDFVGWVEHSDTQQSHGMNERWVSLRLTHPTRAHEADVANTFSQIRQQMGEVQTLIYNAHELFRAPFVETNAADFERLWRVNTLGAFMCAQEAMKDMLRAKNGTIIFSGATASLRAGAKSSAFSSSKFALRGLAQALAREHGSNGIHVCHIVIDGLIWGRAAESVHKVARAQCLEPAAVVNTFLGLIDQQPSAWTQELDIRPMVENF
jgi:NAD(P)-dependent dehydrogenase (short-subunit alcohol dehydrogenase family)